MKIIFDTKGGWYVESEVYAMYRVQLFVNEDTRRGRTILGSWTCPTKEVAEKKYSNLKSKFRDAEYEIVMFEI